MDIKRFISGILGFPLVAVLFIFGNNYVVDITCAVIAIMGLYEFYNAFKDKAKPIAEVGYFSALFIAGLHIINYHWWLLYLPILILLAFLKVILTKMKFNINDLAITILGIVYIVGSIAFIPLIHGLEHGKILVWYIFLAAWGTDIFAYLIGVKFGKHKFSKISPKKSIEGCIGGIIGAIIFMLVYTICVNNLFNLGISYIYIAIIAIVLSVIGQIGDFAASTIKRYAGIKDFSNLIPGHGGLLDRMDSVMFVAPFIYLFFVLM